MNDSVTDLTRGVYRRLYSGFIKGQRINRLSLEAEAWFWRILATVDDFGNADADPGLCFAATVGRRPGITTEKVTGWLDEMRESGLIQIYAENGDRYLHIVGFEGLQPAGRNGKRVRRFPEFSAEEIQVNPDLLNAPHSDTDTHSDTHSEDDSEVGSRNKPRSPGKPKICDETYLCELQSDEAYKRLNVQLVHAKMVRWCKEKGKVPTRSRLINWLNREDQPIDGFVRDEHPNAYRKGKMVL